MSAGVLFLPLFLFQIRMRLSRTEKLTLRWDWIRHFGPVMLSLLVESGRVSGALLGTLAGRSPVGRTAVDRFASEGRNDAERRGHRALAGMIGSASPNGIVLSIADDEQSCNVHRLLPARGRAPAGWPA
ncbi:hypothetical protein [Gluconacetobacter takamatsuzukensis]|uniref:Uncharacterized protein n=1 Tax=Gluconacetobacter takamatsuzukensis TaxID=1286190 RepID=A0A7W4KFR7_9PROT|nr:hypothetical protein [Gluconacetobacter takamatsuzukensis]MBB2206121.1 hypothetical protein [Gluconacetobacter takamatsuzukensis]